MFSIKFFRRLFTIILFAVLIFALLRWGGRIPEKIFSRPYADTVEKYSNTYGVDSNLVFSVMRAESRFQPDAVSHKGALGLMQLMEETALWAAPQAGITIAGKEDILQVDNNIHLGIWILSDLLHEYEGDLIKTLCAYNAGSGNVAKWLEDEEHSQDGETLDTIPFGETKRYVEKVLWYYQMYQKIYSDAL